jgi:hypothetical protein
MQGEVVRRGIIVVPSQMPAPSMTTRRLQILSAPKIPPLFPVSEFPVMNRGHPDPHICGRAGWTSPVTLNSLAIAVP